MFLVTPNPSKEKIEEDNLYIVNERGELPYYIETCAKKSDQQTACVWVLSEEYIGKYKEFKMSGFKHTDKGEVLPI